MIIRNFTPADFEEIKSWWIAANDPVPVDFVMPEETTFVAEVDGQLVASYTLFLTNSKEMAYMHFLAANPKFKSADRKFITAQLVDYLANVAKHLGYKRVITLTNKPKLKKHFQENFNLKPTLNDVSTFVREL